ncbi:MAG TPA: hypothetical protein VLH86_04395 [Patescibacteria group bacterium]|nr:hypothetical protein [Patescibacteria group bacterium]
MGRLLTKLATSKPLALVSVVSLLIAAGPFNPPRVFAGDLIDRSLTASDSFAGTPEVTYSPLFTIATTGTVGSVAIMFCANTPLLDQPCDPPPGLDATSTSITGQGGMTGFSIFGGSTANVIILTRPPAAANAGDTAFYEFNKIHNPNNPGPLFARFLTFASSDGSGPPTDGGGMALYINNSVDINAEVPPYLTFCLGENITSLDCSTATEPFTDMGSFSPNLTSAAQHQIIVATNAPDGYSMWALGSSMTSGSDVITPMSGGTSVKGTSQFGINLRANSTPNVGQDATGPGFAAVTAGYNQQNHFRFNSGDMLATAPVPDDFRKYTISYIVNIPAGQPGGVYSTTLTYVCLANF